MKPEPKPSPRNRAGPGREPAREGLDAVADRRDQQGDAEGEEDDDREVPGEAVRQSEGIDHVDQGDGGEGEREGQPGDHAQRPPPPAGDTGREDRGQDREHARREGGARPGHEREQHQQCHRSPDSEISKALRPAITRGLTPRSAILGSPDAVHRHLALDPLEATLAGERELKSARPPTPSASFTSCATTTLSGRAKPVIRAARLTGRPYQSPPRLERLAVSDAGTQRRGSPRRPAASTRPTTESSSGAGSRDDEHRRVADHLHQADRRTRRLGGQLEQPAGELADLLDLERLPEAGEADQVARTRSSPRRTRTAFPRPARPR